MVEYWKASREWTIWVIDDFQFEYWRKQFMAKRKNLPSSREWKLADSEQIRSLIKVIFEAERWHLSV